ncbi:MAG: hypothetical protein R6W85_10285 [Gillisia sp.]
MKNIIILFSLFLSFSAVHAQETPVPAQVERLEQQKEKIIAEEKEALKKTVEKINLKLEKQEITKVQATNLKEEAARKHALNIENRIAIIENEIAWITRNDDLEIEDSSSREVKQKEHKKSSYKHRNRTTTHLMVAAGFNNALEQGQSISDADFKLAGSRFFELGLSWRTRVFEDSNFLRLRYGFSFQFNGLKPTDNRYFVEDGALTSLEVYPMDLKKSKFRMDNIVIPLHFEFGPSKRIDTDSKTWFSTANKLKIGLGGFAGFNIGERQKLKYSDAGGKVRRKNTGDFNTNDFIYGLSGYLGLGGTSLYVKYDLNPIFKEPNVELNNISVGLRFDID